MQGATDPQETISGLFSPAAYLFGKAEPEADFIRIEPAAFVGVGSGFPVNAGAEL